MPDDMSRDGGIRPIGPIRIDPRTTGVPDVPRPSARPPGSPRMPRFSTVDRPIGTGRTTPRGRRAR